MSSKQTDDLIDFDTRESNDGDESADGDEEEGEVANETGESEITESTTTDEKRVRMFVEQGVQSSSLLEDGLPDRWAKAGAFVKESEKKDFDAASIRTSVVPEESGSPVPLDDDDSKLSSSSRSSSIKSSGKILSASESSRSFRGEGVLFSRNHLENYDKYQRKGMFRGKKILFGVGALVAVGLTSVVAYVLGGKVVASNKNRMPEDAAIKNGLEAGINEDWWQASNNENLPPDFNPPPQNNGKSPPNLASLAPLSERYSLDMDTPFIWMIPRTFSMQVRDTIRHCFNHKFTRNYNGLNTDSVFSHLLYEVADSFNGHSPPRRARMFTMLREPLIRTVDMWHSHMQAEGNISLKDYLSKHNDNNWMTRFLTNNFDKPLSIESLEIAKTVLREKCIIGLDTHKKESFANFIHYFGWDNINLETQNCVSTVLHAPGYEDDVTYPKEFSPEYDLLTRRNHMDKPLYEYAVELFGQQKMQLFGDINKN